MRHRVNDNRTDLLVANNGTDLDTPQMNEAEMRRFYIGLLGTRAPSIQAVDLTVVRKGPVIPSSDARMLVRPISMKEIDDALAGIGDSLA